MSGGILVVNQIDKNQRQNRYQAEGGYEPKLQAVCYNSQSFDNIRLYYLMVYETFRNKAKKVKKMPAISQTWR